MTRRRIGGALVVLAAGLVLVAFGFFPQEPLRRFVEGRLRAALGPRARLGSLHVVPGLLRVEMTNVAVDGTSFTASASRVEASLTAGFLVGGSLGLRNLSIDGASLVARPLPGGPSGPWSWPIRIDRLDLTRGTLVYDDPALGGRVTLRELAGHGSVGSGQLDIAVGGGSWGGMESLPLAPSRARLRVSRLLDIRVEELELATAASRLSATGDLGRVGALAPRLNVEGVLDLAEASRALPTTPLVGVVKVTGRVDGTVDALRGQGTAEGASLKAAGWPVDHLQAKLEYSSSGGGLLTGTLSSSLLGGHAQGESRLQGRALTGHLKVESIDIARVAAQRGMTGAGGVLSTDIRVNGNVDHSLGAKVELQGQVVQGSFTTSIRGDATGTIEPRTLASDLTWKLTADGTPVTAEASLPRLGAFEAVLAGTARGVWPPQVEGTVDAQVNAESQGGPIVIPVHALLGSHGSAASVVADARPLGGTLHLEVETHGDVANRLEIRAEGIDVAPLSPDTRGHLDLSAEASGPLTALTGRGSVRAQGLAWRTLDIGPGTLDVDAQSGLGHLVLALPDLHLSGEASLPVEHEARGTLTLTETPLAPLVPLLPAGTSLEGLVSGQIAFQVPLAEPSAARAQGEVTRLAATSGRFSTESSQAFHVSFAAGQATVDGMSVKGPGYALSASGRFGLDEHSPIDGRVSLETDLSSLPVPEGWTLSGHVRSDVTLSGTRSDPRGRGTITATAASVAGPKVPPTTVAEAHVVLEGDMATLAPAKAVLGDGSLTVAGRVPIALLLPLPSQTNPGPAHLDVTWEGLQASALLARLTADGTSPMAAALSGHAEVTGDPFATDTLHGTATLAATAIQIEDLALNLTPLELKLEAGRVSTIGVTAWTDQGSLQLAGSVDIPRRTLDLSAYGQLALRSLSPLVGTASLSGSGDVSVTAKGTFDAPGLDGKVWVRDATVRLRDIPETLSALNGVVVLEGSLFRFEETTGVVGGGDVRLSGGGRLEKLGVADVKIDVTGRDMALRYPAGLRSRVEADLSLTGRSGGFQLAGQVRVQRGVYDLETALRQNMKTVAAEATRSPALRAVGLDVRVSIDTPIMIRHKLASLEVGGSLSFSGDMETPLPFGRLEIPAGGRISFQGRDFTTNAGGLTYSGSWNPNVSVRAGRRIRDSDPTRREDYDVELVAEGPLDTVQPTFQAPGLSSAEAFSLVATGRTTNTSLNTGAMVAGGAAASLLVGRLSGNLGLDEVTVQPELLARETDPGTRFTFGKQVTNAISLIYSLGLQGPEDRFLQVEYLPWRSVSLKVQRSDDGTVTVGAGQRLAFGGVKKQKSRKDDKDARLTEVRLEGDRPLAEDVLRKSLKSRVGKKTTPWGIQEDADRLRERLVKENLIESEVGGRLEGTVASFRIRSGPRFTWTVAGVDDPPDLGKEVRKALFEEEALERGRALLLATLRGRGRLRAKVTGKGRDEAGGRVLAFEAEAGPRLEAEVHFSGAHALSEKRLRQASGGAAQILTTPQAAARGIQEAYRAIHRFDVTLEPPRIEEAEDRVVIEWAVTEGSPAVLASVRYVGSSRSEEDLEKATKLTIGGPFTDDAVLEALDRLRGDYLAKGFPKSRVTAEVARHAKGADVTFQMIEGSPVRIGHIDIAGLKRTRESVVRRRLRLKTGEPLDPRRLSRTERRLMELGIFARVIVTASEGDPSDVLITVQEDAPLVTSYDVRYNDEDKTTVQADAETRNIAGVGLVVGGRYRVGAKVREARGSVFLPSVVKSGNLTGSIFNLQEDQDAVDPFTLEPFTNTTVQTGFQLQQKVPLSDRWDLLPGYRFKREHSTGFPDPINLASVDASLVRDTRNNPLDARKGRFLSLNLDYAPKALGSDLTFTRGFAQAFLAHAVGSSWTWAQGFRLGLAKGFGGQEVVRTERFTAGGSNSLRGYATDSVGPRDFLNEPKGGEAVIIVNEELRFRHPSRFGFALFYDGGNVYDTVSDISLKLRHDLGFGLRWESPVGLLRIDLGFPLNRQEGDKSYQLFLNLGQAF